MRAMAGADTHEPPVAPPFYLEKGRRREFGEVFVGDSRQIVEGLLQEEGVLQEQSRRSLAKQVQEYVYKRENRERYVATAMNYLRRKRPHIRTSYDVVLVGAGIHAANFLYALRKKNPDIRVLIVERTDAICATFFKFGDSLVLNSPTFSKVGFNSNIMQGHFVQVSDFDELVEKPFPTAKHLYELAVMVFFHGDADIVFNFEVDSITRSEGGYRVSSKDTNVTAGSVVISNGMGDPNRAAYVRDTISERTIDGDDFISACYKSRAFLDDKRGKRVAIVGAGDTANCVMEYLMPLVYPNKNYGFYSERPFLPKSIYWIGQNAKDVKEFGFANKLRYCHSGGLIEFFWDGDAPFDLPTDTWKRSKALIRCVPDKLVSLSHKGNSLQLRTETELLEVDFVVDCTGRSNALSAKLLASEYEFIQGDIVLYGGQWDESQDSFVLSPRYLEARRIACKLKGERIFVIGSACPLDRLIADDEARSGSLEHQEDRTSLTNSKWSLEHTLPRSLAFAELFADTALKKSPLL